MSEDFPTRPVITMVFTAATLEHAIATWLDELRGAGIKKMRCDLAVKEFLKSEAARKLFGSNRNELSGDGPSKGQGLPEA